MIDTVPAGCSVDLDGGHRPTPPDQVPVPPEEGLGLNEEPAPTPAVKQSAQPGE
jgi:hypothetical protein